MIQTMLQGVLRGLTANPLPIVTKELTEQAARKRTYVVRTVYAIALFMAFGFLYSRMVGGVGGATAFARGDRSLLGTGRTIFELLVTIQLAAIHVLLPATLAGAITEERERDSLELLLLTRLSSFQIVIQKLIGRLIAVFTLVLLSLPLFALAYSFGGIGKADIWLAVYWLTLSGVYVGSFTLMISCTFRSTAQALSAAYLLGAPMILVAIPFLGGVASAGIAWSAEVLGSESLYHIALSVEAAARPPHQIYRDHLGQPGGWDAWLYGFSTLALSALFLAVGCAQLKSRRHERRGSAALKFQRRLDSAVREVNEAMGGIVLFRGRDVPPGDQPVLWRESRKRALGKPEYFVRALLTLELPTVAIATIILVSARTWSGRIDWTGLAYMSVFFWIVASLSIAICAVHLISNERSRRTLDVLLTTPLSGREILSQKVRGLRRLKLLFAIPLLTTIFMRAFVEATQSHDAPVLVYVFVSALTFLVYMELFSWLALWIGMKIENRGRAALTAVIGLTLWCVVPLLLGWGTWLAFLSPAALIRLSETPVAFYSSFLGGSALLNFALYIALWAAARRHCLANADRLLGRAPVSRPPPSLRTGSPPAS